MQEAPRPIEEITRDLDALFTEIEAAPSRDERREIQERLDEIFDEAE